MTYRLPQSTRYAGNTPCTRFLEEKEWRIDDSKGYKQPINVNKPHGASRSAEWPAIFTSRNTHSLSHSHSPSSLEEIRKSINPDVKLAQAPRLFARFRRAVSRRDRRPFIEKCHHRSRDGILKKFLYAWTREKERERGGSVRLIYIANVWNSCDRDLSSRATRNLRAPALAGKTFNPFETHPRDFILTFSRKMKIEEADFKCAQGKRELYNSWKLIFSRRETRNS